MAVPMATPPTQKPSPQVHGPLNFSIRQSFSRAKCSLLNIAFSLMSTPKYEYFYEIYPKSKFVLKREESLNNLCCHMRVTGFTRDKSFAQRNLYQSSLTYKYWLKSRPLIIVIPFLSQPFKEKDSSKAET